MSDLTKTERRKLERLFEMESGYILDFSHNTLGDFIEEHTGRDVYDPKYPQRGSGSKAWRVRAFWEVEPNHLAGKLIVAFIDHRATVLERQAAAGGTILDVTPQPDEARLVEECRRIAARLMQGAVVHEIDAIQAPAGEPDFETVVREIHDVIRRNQPEAGLDRLHTFVVKFVRSLCAGRGIVATRDRPLHSLFGEYVKSLRAAGHLESEMTERILKSSIGTLEAFNDVRNEQSLAHDNPILNHAESLLIFNHVAATLRFIKTLEDRFKQPAAAENAPPPPTLDDDIPF